MDAKVIFIHGAGQAGADAWPQQAAVEEQGWFFLPREGVADDAHRDASRILERLSRTDGGHFVAHSYGANAALLAAREAPDLVRSVALLEPACFDLARGRQAVEDHVTRMTPVFEVAADPTIDAREFSRRFAHGMGFPPPDLSDEELAENVNRLRTLRPPWDLDLRQELRPPTLVLTGGVRPLYEQTAQELTKLGAEHRTFDGAGHRVQDDARATPTLREWFSEQR